MYRRGGERERETGRERERERRKEGGEKKEEKREKEKRNTRMKHQRFLTKKYLASWLADMIKRLFTEFWRENT